jgi:hypothetical protein
MHLNGMAMGQTNRMLVNMKLHTHCSHVRLNVSIVVKIHIVVFWIMTLCRDVAGYQHF